MQAFIVMNAVPEMAANIIVTVSILFAGRNSVHTWWLGIVGCTLFAFVFYQAQLYADVALQCFFVATSARGWWQWRRGAYGQPLLVSKVEPRILAVSTVCGLLAAFTYGALLHGYTNAYAPYVDSAVLVFSVIAQLLLMRRQIDSWVFWLVVNSIAVPLYASRGLYLTSALYAVYWINALVSWRRWKRLAAADRQLTAVRNLA